MQDNHSITLGKELHKQDELDVLSDLIASVYKGAEDKLERHIPTQRHAWLSAKDWIYDHLNEREEREGTDGVTDFIGRLGRLDQIAQQLGIDDEIAHDERKSEILRRLNISEHTSPKGIYADLEEIDKLIDECNVTTSYHDLLGKGVDVCTKIEHMLNLLVSFYVGICFEAIFSNYLEWASRGIWRGEPQRLKRAALKTLCHHIDDKSLKDLVRDFFERDRRVELGSMTNILVEADRYSAALPEFKGRFKRDSIFAPREAEVKTVLEEIRGLRNPLPHDKIERPEGESLRTVSGLRQHLKKLFGAIARFKGHAEILALFPKAGLLVEKFDRLNRGTRIELFLETKRRVCLTCDNFGELIIGAEYFLWQSPGYRDYVLLIKRFPKEVKYVTSNSSYLVPR